MADEKEKVLYEFQGDVSSLKKSTQDALDLLDKFQTTMDQLNSEGIVKASQRAQSGFQNSINKMSKGIGDVQKKLNSVGDVKMPRGTEAFNATKAATDTLTSTLGKLNSSNTITSKSLNEMKASLNTVTSRLKGAGSSFDNLITKEEKFQKRLASIDGVAKKFSSKLHGATDSVKGAFNNMGAAVGAKLSAIGVKFEPLVSKMQGFKDKATIAGNRISQVFSTVAAAFRRTSDSSDDAAQSQDKLGKTQDSVGEKVKEHAKGLSDLLSEIELVGPIISAAANVALAGVGAVTSAFSTLTGAVSGVVDSFFALAGVKTGDLLSEGAKGAIDYVENMNLFQVAMGQSIDKGRAFVNQMGEVYGMDPSNLYRYSGYFYQLTDAIGMSEEASATMSLSMTKAANDIASLFNSDVETVVNDLASGMQGMSRSVRKYGMDIRATTLEQTAMKYGIEGNVETMSEANRQALRYITMLEQTQNALQQTTNAIDGASAELGDFARNIESPANQLRIFKEQMSQLGRAIGNFIVAPLQMALPYINGFVMALRTAINFLATIVGVSVKASDSFGSAGESAEDAASGVGSIGNAADKTTKKLKQMVAPFDELNVLSESSGEGADDSMSFEGALDPSLAKALEEMELNLENITMKANTVRDSILGFLGLKVTTDPITGDQIIQWDKESFMTNVMGSLNQFKEWFLNTPQIVQCAAMIAAAFAGIAAAAVILTSLLSPVLAIIPAFLVAIGAAVALVIFYLTSLLILSEPFRTSFVELFSKVGASILEWGTILSGVFTTVGTDLVTMWDTHIKPTIEAIGAALAPALDTLGSLWDNLSVIVSDIFSKIGNLWTTVLKPVMEGAMEIIQDLSDKFKKLWEEFVGPVIEYIGDGLEDLWTNSFSPVLDSIIGLLGEFWDLVMLLWRNVLSPLIDWLASTFGPCFKSTFTTLWDSVKPIIQNIVDAVGGIIEALRGMIKFLTGVFSGDWQKAWDGIKQYYKGIWDSFVDIVKIPINLIIGLINRLIDGVEAGLNFVIDGINNISFDVPDWVPGIGGKHFGFNLKRVNWGNIPYLAKGGVVTGPTPAMIGEGSYSEAVIPLDDSPQMNELIDKIVEAIDKDDGPSSSPVEVRVFIGDNEYDAYTYKASERGKKIVGKQPVKIGG